jgi:hypothetical protein
MPQIAQIDVDLYLHVRVLISMILGLSVARLVSGVASFIQHPSRFRVWPIHLGWVVWTLMNVLMFWWWEFRLRLIDQWNLGMYLFICLYASMYYFLSVLLFPDDIREYGGYEDYLLSRRAWFFGFAALTEVIDLGDTWIKGAQYFWSKSLEYFIYIPVFVVLCAIAARTRNPRFHAFFVIGALLYEAVHYSRTFYTLS